MPSPSHHTTFRSKRRSSAWAWSVWLLVFGWVLLHHPQQLLSDVLVSVQSADSLSHQDQLRDRVFQALATPSHHTTPDQVVEGTPAPPRPKMPWSETTWRKLELCLVADVLTVPSRKSLGWPFPEPAVMPAGPTREVRPHPPRA